ncbi:GspE/PulE family protein [Helicobacter burdigaliensis]|uniref:GspE/PulE family protein n=1 Tax=Helicobacter burdigaliensis TaxID=2315334 RepID=UPI000EF6E542|nr:GspE/PulE family protein [Helicobacter burdigaliensis]
MFVLREIELGEINLEIAKLLNLEQMKHFGAICLDYREEHLQIALLESSKEEAEKTLPKILNPYKIQFFYITKENFQEILHFLEIEQNIALALEEIPKSDLQNKDSKVIFLLENIMQDAIYKGASDIHIEQTSKECKIRFRLDSVLVDRLNLPSYLNAPLMLCLKLFANLNIAEVSLPQDGRFSYLLKDTKGDKRNYDFRISTLPLVEGESAVLRVLDNKSIVLPLKELGLSKEELEKILKMAHLPYGFVLISGPTGSGKSTTLHAILNQIKHKNLKIISLEDPVEYRLENITQVAIHKEISFASVLKNILRQDPDVIMIGEIRDKETLQVALRAAFTGHLVFSTLHTNDALEAIPRLIDMGVEQYFLKEALSGVIAQRLLRKLCPLCKVKVGEFYKARGCVKCNFTGFKGRVVIAEILLMNETLKAFIDNKLSKEKILEILQKEGDYSLLQKALCKAKSGITSLKEVYRVVK